MYMYAFFYFHPDYFWVFLKTVKQQTEKTSKIGYNLIFITTIFSENGWKDILKGSQMV